MTSSVHIESTKQDERTSIFDRIKQSPTLPYFLLILITVAIYWEVVSFGVMDTWDDQLFFLKRPELENWWGVSWYERLVTPKIGYPIPIPTFLYVLIQSLPGDWVLLASHGISVLLQCVNACLVYTLIARWLKQQRTPAFFAVLLWASHPLLVESVAWVTNLKTVSFATMLLGAVLIWEFHLQTPKRRYLVLSGLFALLAFGCRPEAVIIGPLLFARTFWVGGWAQLRRPIYGGLPVLLGIFAIIFIPMVINSHTDLVAQSNTADATTFREIKHYRRIFSALTLQFWHIIYPSNLNPAYYWDHSTAIHLTVFGVLIALVWFGAIIWTWQIKHPSGWPLLFAAVCYLPASGVEYLPRFLADTYMYLPLIGILAAALTMIPRTKLHERKHFWALLIGLLTFALAANSYIQSKRWENTLTLWEPMMESTADLGQAHFMVGVALTHIYEYKKATEVFDEGYYSMTQWLIPPAEAAVAYSAIGNNARAYEILMDILVRTDKPQNAQTDGYFILLLTNNQLHWPEGGKFQKAAERAARRAYHSDTISPESYPIISRYFYGQEQEELGALYAEPLQQ